MREGMAGVAVRGGSKGEKGDGGGKQEAWVWAAAASSQQPEKGKHRESREVGGACTIHCCIPTPRVTL